MATRLNAFGATATQLKAMYPGTVAADYDGGGAGGDTLIGGVLERIAREIASAMTPEVYKQITQVDCQEVISYATSGQTTCTLGIIPVVAGTVHLWVYPSVASQEISSLSPGQFSDEIYFKKPVLGRNELPSDDYSVTAATGAVVLDTGLALGQRLYASFDVDLTSSSFALPSVGDLVLLGAAAELGARLYSDASQEWKLVEEYRSRYRGAFQITEGGFTGRALSGSWIPDEIRALTFFHEVDRSSSVGVDSVRLYRG